LLHSNQKLLGYFFAQGMLTLASTFIFLIEIKIKFQTQSFKSGFIFLRIRKMNEQNINLRDFLLRRKLNLSKSSWKQLVDSKWHDEIYRREDPFKRYRSLQPSIYPVCTWKNDNPTFIATSLLPKR